MPILVQKFGGSSVADLEKLRRVAHKIVETKRRGYDLVVVVSAMGDTTDDLLAMAREMASEPPRRELDMLLSVGERISMALLSMAIQQHGLHAISLTGSQCGIITTSSHANARIIDVRPFRVQDELEQGHVVIVAGYQGTSYKREVTTLGRGGSDTTAVALAAALGAEACEIYSDVDGIYSADPRVVLEATRLHEIGLDEMLQMSRSGARVLNAQAVEFARHAKIALHARATHTPHSHGTIVRPDGFDVAAARVESGLPAVAASHIERALWCQIPHDRAEAIDALELLTAEWGDGVFKCLISLENVSDHDALASGLRDQGARVQERGLISAVGHGIGARPVWWRRADEALCAGGITPLARSIHDARLSWIVPCEQVTEGVRCLHQTLVYRPDT